MKTISNSPILKAWLARKPELTALALRESFSFEESLFEKTAHAIAAHHPQMNQASVEIRAALQLLFAGHPGEAQEPESEAETEMIVDSLEIRLPKWVRPWAIAVFIVLCVIAFAAILKAEPEPANAIPQRQVLAAFHSNPGVLAQFGGLVIQLQNAGSTLATRGGGLVIFNCTGSGLSCSWSGSTFTMNGSGGGGTGCVPPGTTLDALLYDSGSGTCPDVTKWSTNGTTTITAAATAILDLSAAATLKVPTAAGCNPTTSAVACYDSTNHLWVFGNNGTKQTLCDATGGTSGQVFESNGSGCGGYADPIVSGPDAPGAAPTKNPVQMGSFDGTDVQRVSSDSSGRLNVNINGTVPVSGTFWQATQPVSGTFWQATQPVSGTFWQSTQPVSTADGSQVTLGSKADAKSTATDTTAITIMQVLKEISAMEQAPASTPVTGTFWQATQPVSGTFWQATQPVSAASLPLPSGAATSANQCGSAVGSPCAAGGSGTASALTVQPFCDSTVIKNNFSTSGSTQIVAAPGSAKNVYICGFAVNGASTTLNTVKLVYGTKTTNDCDTGANDLSIAVPIQTPSSVAPAGQNVSPPPNVVWKTGATNNQVCVNLSAAQAINLQVWYKTD